MSGSGYREASTEFTWICAIANNLCNDFFKENSRKAELSEAENYVSSIGNGEDTLFQKETSLEIHKILHSLDEPYKEVFELRVFEELSFYEISVIFGKTESWARVTYHRARLKIKERMDSNE